MNVRVKNSLLPLPDWSWISSLPMKFSFVKPEPFPEYIAAIDLGSNSFHMVVARLQDGQLSKLDRIKEMVRLGAGLDEQNKLSEEAIQKALDCLARFGQRLNHMPPGSVRIVGTKTLRRANNARIFLQQAERVLHHPIQVISGVEEARLIYKGVAHGLNHEPPQKRLVIDIGGGSTELIIGQAFAPVRLESLGVGCVSLSQRFFADGTITRKKVRTALLTVLQVLEPYASWFQEENWDEAIGASGTIKTVGKIINNAGWSTGEITSESLSQLIEHMIKLGDMKEFDLPGLSSERAAVFPGGAVLLAALFEGLRIKTLKVSDSALREGVLYDIIGRIGQDDVRSASVSQLADKFACDSSQAERVSSSVQQLALQAVKKWKLEQEDVSLLEWAAQLHEIGLGIAHSQYYKHGAYIAENADLAGFSQQEQSLLALLIRSHRGKFPLTQFKNFNGKKFRSLMRLAILLRLAVLLHRSRNPASVPEIIVQADKQSLSLEFPPDWLEAHPLTQADLESEAELLKKTLDFDLMIC